MSFQKNPPLARPPFHSNPPRWAPGAAPQFVPTVPSPTTPSQSHGFVPQFRAAAAGQPPSRPRYTGNYRSSAGPSPQTDEELFSDAEDGIPYSQASTRRNGKRRATTPAQYRSDSRPSESNNGSDVLMGILREFLGSSSKPIRNSRNVRGPRQKYESEEAADVRVTKVNEDPQERHDISVSFFFIALVLH